MSVVLTQSYLTGLQTGYNATFRSSLDERMKKASVLAHRILREESSAGMGSVTYDMLAGMPILKELPPSGNQEEQNVSTNQFTLANKTFTRLIGLKREVLERKGSSLYLNDIKKSAGAYVQWREVRLAQRLLVDGFDPAKLSYTGQPLFSAAHKNAKGKLGAFSNKVTGKLNEARLNTGVENLQSRSDADGNKLNLGLSGLLLVVGPKNRALGAQLVQNARKANGADNENKDVAELVVWPQITDDKWLLIDTSWTEAGIHQIEVPISSYMATNPNESGIILSGKFPFQLYHRGDIDVVEPLVLYGSDGSVA
jgi:phage major head subunit gpT-like protein